MKFLIVLLVALACVMAAEERVKKDVLVNGMLVRGIDARGFDDGSYWPGKYIGTGYGAYPYAWGGWAGNWGARSWWY